MCMIIPTSSYRREGSDRAVCLIEVAGDWTPNSFLMPPKQPQLGSLAIQEPGHSPQVVQVSTSTCHDLTLFKGQCLHTSFQPRS